MSFGKLQSMGGNYVSRLGGADILSQDQLQSLSPQELQIYNQQKEMSKTAGMRELASRLSDAFAGRDIVGRAAIRREDIEKKSERDRKLKLQQDLQQAIADGDMDKAYAISAILQPGSVAQNIIQSQAGPSKKDLQPQVSSDGTITTFFDLNKETGEVTTRVEINKDAVEAQRQLDEIELQKKPLPDTAIKSQLDNEATINSFNYQNKLIGTFIKQIDNNTLQFGPGEGLQDFIGRRGFVFGEDSQERLSNKTAFERWKESYVNTILQNAKGPQTDGDARRALNQLKYAETKTDVKNALQGVLDANADEVSFNKKAINTRRENYGKSPLYSSEQEKPIYTVIGKTDGS